MILKNLLKKLLPISFIYKLILIRDLPKTFKIKFGKYVLKFLITDIKDKKNNKLFTLRNFGGSTISRGFHLFSSQPKLATWIDNFDKNSFFVDIGANIGLYSLYAATKKHKVIAFEPESLNFACLNLNIMDNNFKNYITAYPISIHDKNEISFLNMRTMKFGGSGSSFDTTFDENQQNFDPIYKQGSISFQLDEILKKNNFEVNYIKIDVDGNELNVIKSMPETMKSDNLKSICVELNPSTENGKEIIHILKKDFPKYERDEWAKNQNVYNYFFER